MRSFFAVFVSLPSACISIRVVPINNRPQHAHHQDFSLLERSQLSSIIDGPNIPGRAGSGLFRSVALLLLALGPPSIRAFSLPSSRLPIGVASCTSDRREVAAHRATNHIGRLPRISMVEARPYTKGVYNPEEARSFFSTRPLQVISRGIEIFVRSSVFGVGLISDFVNKEIDANADARAKQCTELLVNLGPTFIKLGQSASVRSDLMPPAYLRSLKQLQDSVPAFSNDQAFSVILEDFKGRSPFVRVSEEPIAAASLGQVYKGQMRDGRIVAIKVLRPKLERNIALDLLLVRDVVAPLAKALQVPGDLVGTVDEWGIGLVDELNYKGEAANSVRFNTEMANSSLKHQVFAPDVVQDACSDRVLTTVWVDGERIDCCSTPDDVPRLCALAMNSYLEMMLQTGHLHCDPHPGNLLRTDDGRLCILDWGLVQQIPTERQLTLIEHVAHLTARDYKKIPNDLMRLGFVPNGAEDTLVESGVSDFLAKTYGTWQDGGGAANFNIPQLLDEVTKLSAGTSDGLFQIPPYFAYVAKAFSVLEGIGLTLDPTYSIVDETLPYISRRIVFDPSPRTAGALETFVYGNEEGKQLRVLNADRVETLLVGLKKYSDAIFVPAEFVQGTKSSEGEDESTENDDQGNEEPLILGGFDVEAAADQIFDVLLSEEDLPVQDIVLDQVALVLGASAREAWGFLREFLGTSIVLGRPRLDTLIDPLELFKGSPVLEMDSRDHEVLTAARKLADIASELLAGNEYVESAAGGPPAIQPTADELRRLVSMIADKLYTRRTAVQTVSRRLASKILLQTTERLENRGSYVP